MDFSLYKERVVVFIYLAMEVFWNHIQAPWAARCGKINSKMIDRKLHGFPEAFLINDLKILQTIFQLNVYILFVHLANFYLTGQ